MPGSNRQFPTHSRTIKNGISITLSQWGRQCPSPHLFNADLSLDLSWLLYGPGVLAQFQLHMTLPSKCTFSSHKCLYHLSKVLRERTWISGQPVAWLPWVIYLPLVQSLWPGKGTHRTKAAPSRAASRVACAKGRLGREGNLLYVEEGLQLCVRVAFTGHLINPRLHSWSLCDISSLPNGLSHLFECPQGWRIHSS